MTDAVRVAVVTGAGSGIGAGVATALLADGWSVALAGRRAEMIHHVAAESGAPESCHLVVPTDVRDPDAVDVLFDAVEERFGRVDLLFNNAGIGAPARGPDELSVERWLAVVETNLNGSFLCTRRAFALMKRQEPRGGRIINNGSISAHTPRPRSVAYTATKHAITGLTKSTALDGREHGIACGQIDIGNAATGIMAGAAGGFAQPDGSQRVEATMDVARAVDAVLFMAGQPLDANVLFMTVMATNMPFVGRG